MTENEEVRVVSFATHSSLIIHTKNDIKLWGRRWEWEDGEKGSNIWRWWQASRVKEEWRTTIKSRKRESQEEEMKEMGEDEVKEERGCWIYFSLSDFLSLDLSPDSLHLSNLPLFLFLPHIPWLWSTSSTSSSCPPHLFWRWWSRWWICNQRKRYYLKPTDCKHFLLCSKSGETVSDGICLTVKWEKLNHWRRRRQKRMKVKWTSVFLENELE